MSFGIDEDLSIGAHHVDALQLEQVHLGTHNPAALKEIGSYYFYIYISVSMPTLLICM